MNGISKFLLDRFRDLLYFTLMVNKLNTKIIMKLLFTYFFLLLFIRDNVKKTSGSLHKSENRP